MVIMSEVLPYYKTRAGENLFSSKTFNDVIYKLHPLFIAIYLIFFCSNKYFDFMKKTILQIRNLTKQALKLDHGYMFEFQQIKRFNILTICLAVMNGLTNNTRYSKN